MPVTEERLLTTREVAAVFRVNPNTVTRWARSGQLKAIITPGGRLRRFRESDVATLLGSVGGAA